MRRPAITLAMSFGLLIAGCALAPPTTTTTAARSAAQGDDTGLSKSETVILWPMEIAPASVIAPTTPCSNSGVNTASCTLRIQVSDQGTDSCTIVLANSGDDLITLGEVGSNTTISWEIVAVAGNDQYIFSRSDGVTFADNIRNRRAFVDGARSNDGKTFQWRKRNRGPRVYAYVINVRNQRGDRDCSLDPWIRNIA